MKRQILGILGLTSGGNSFAYLVEWRDAVGRTSDFGVYGEASPTSAASRGRYRSRVLLMAEGRDFEAARRNLFAMLKQRSDLAWVRLPEWCRG